MILNKVSLYETTLNRVAQTIKSRQRALYPYKVNKATDVVQPSVALVRPQNRAATRLE